MCVGGEEGRGSWLMKLVPEVPAVPQDRWDSRKGEHTAQATCLGL